jgi:hypothetical protein
MVSRKIKDLWRIFEASKSDADVLAALAEEGIDKFKVLRNDWSRDGEMIILMEVDDEPYIAYLWPTQVTDTQGNPVFDVTADIMPLDTVLAELSDLYSKLYKLKFDSDVDSKTVRYWETALAYARAIIRSLMDSERW